MPSHALFISLLISGFMKSALFLFLILIQTSVVVWAQSTVFKSGESGYKSFRIPAIVRGSDGSLVAFAEGRVGGGGDFGNIDIVVRRSRDGGKTWSDLAIVVDNGRMQAGNPAPVFDLMDPNYPKGRLFLFYNIGDNHEGEVRKGNGLREVLYKTSADFGVTWSEPVNITTQVHKPRQPARNPQYRFDEDWRSYANTPGHALQFQGGPYKGRIYVPANHSVGAPKADYTDYVANGFFSDDHGKSYGLSKDLPLPGSNEATAAEISGGRLLFNSRNQKGDVKARIVASSKDGGATWDTTYFDRGLPDPVCQGSLLTIGKRGKHHILAFSNAADTLRRDNLTLRVSFDDGATWPVQQTIDKSPTGEKDFTAYSDLVQLSASEVGVLYERDHYKTITFKKIRWKR
jgi:sialidase-1